MCRPNDKISKAAAQAFIARRPFRRDDTETERDNRSHVLYMATGAAEGYGEDDIDEGCLTSDFDPTFAERIVVWGIKEG